MNHPEVLAIFTAAICIGAVLGHLLDRWADAR